MKPLADNPAGAVSDAALTAVEVSADHDQWMVEFEITAPLLFDLDLRLRLNDAEGNVRRAWGSRDAHFSLPWLPRGHYRLTCQGTGPLPGQVAALEVALWADCDAGERRLAQMQRALVSDSSPNVEQPGAVGQPGWRIACTDGKVDVGALSWNRGHDDWFFRHFDHATTVILGLMLKHSELLKGRILDIGCGEGINDLSIFHRCRPELLVGIDPFEGYRNLPAISRDNQVPDDWMDDPRLRFEPHDARDIPYPDDSFDVVLSWGVVEHVVGGYAGLLDEARRVLRPGGVFFCLPGLYYGAIGNHLGEFFDDPWLHLKLPAEELRERVLGATPRYVDRAGVFASSEEYWQWYTELNRITVDDFEQQLRARDFEPWRVALRTSPVVEYTPELQGYRFADLATSELYVSAWNRKGRP